jgi:NADH-quinone oxidoreductase subunit H
MELLIESGFVLGKIAVMIGFVMTLAALLTWVERKQSAVLQDRIGANRADILGFRLIGLFHIIADSLKMIMKEDWVPPGGDKLLHALAPIIGITSVLLTLSVIPFGDTLLVAGYVIPLQIAPLQIGILFILGVTSLRVYSNFLAGWASNNKFALLGGLRATAQMISYEIVLGLSLIGIIMTFNTLDLSKMVTLQGGHWFGTIPMWGIFLQPLGCLLFFIAGLAESERVPFDMPEGESEIIGFFVEYSSMKMGMFMFGEFIQVIILSAIMTTIFFGGWQIPWLYADGVHWPWDAVWQLPHYLIIVLQVAAFMVKVVVLCWFQLMIRWTLPRFRYDQVMKLGWQMLLPLALINLMITGIILVL